MKLSNKKVHEIWKRLIERRRKEEFKKLLKYGKPSRMTDYPGPS